MGSKSANHGSNERMRDEKAANQWFKLSVPERIDCFVQPLSSPEHSEHALVLVSASQVLPLHLLPDGASLPLISLLMLWSAELC